MTTSAARTPLSRSSVRRAASRWSSLLALVSVLAVAGCRVDGAAVIAPYRSPPLTQLAALAVAGPDGVLALSPDGTLAAVLDPRRGVCFQAIGAAARPVVCSDLPSTDLAPTDSPPTGTLSAAFSPDGRWVAVGKDVTARGRGLVWLVDPRTGSARPVPAADGRPAVASPVPSLAPSSGASTGPFPSSRPPTDAADPPSRKAPGTATYTALVWGASGDLLLISSSLDPDGLRTRLVDVDPVSLVPRVVAEATGPYEFQSGYLATGGSTVLFTVYRGDQLAPNLVDVDLSSGVRREIGAIGPAGSQLVPLAVSPNGRVAMVGSATLTHPGPPRLMDVASGRLTDVPGLTGDFGVAAFSPDGARVAVVSTGAGGALSVASTGPGTSPAASVRMLGAVPDPLPVGARLGWSQFDVLSLAGRASTEPVPAIGWRLTG